MSLNRTIGQSDNRTWSHKRLFPKAESKINALAANTCMVLARVPLYTLHCALYTVPTPPPPPSTFVFSLPLTYSLSSSYPALSCELRPVSLGPSVAIIYQSQARVPIGFSFLHATPLPRQPPAPCHICDAEANVLCPCAAASQRQFMARTGADSTVRG